MSDNILRYLAANIIVVSAACDASVFDTTPKRDAAVSEDRDAAWTPEQQPDAGDAATGMAMTMLPSQGAGAGGKAGRGGQGGTAGAAQDSAGAAGEAQPQPPKVCDAKCEAPNAKGECKQGDCVYRCDSGFADCDADSSNGCESSLADNLATCGSCDNTCSIVPGALAQCGASKCQTLRLLDEPGQMLAPHGTPIDSTTTYLCPAGSALTGVEGFVVDKLIADSIRIICSPLTLSGSAEQPSIKVGRATVPVVEYAGGTNRAGTAKDPVPVPYKLSCGAGEVVKQLEVTIWAHWGDSNGNPYDTIKDFAIACATPQLANGSVTFGMPGELITTSAELDASAVRYEQDTCGANEAFLGFHVGFGANVDQIATTCSALSLETSDQ
jgi:hypothetical protein